MDLDNYYIGKLPLYCFTFSTDERKRKRKFLRLKGLYYEKLKDGNFAQLLDQVRVLLQQTDVVHDLLAYLAQQMIDLNKDRHRLEGECDLFRFVARDTPCVKLDKALGQALGAGELVQTPADPAVVHHDVEALRLAPEDDGRWRLEIKARLRDPESGWREHQRDQDGHFIRRWLPLAHLPLDPDTGRFYRHAFAHLDGFDGAGKFPGGYTRTTLQKLKATRVPKYVAVDLTPLDRLGDELAEVRRKIRLTDDLIDQIVYRLYGLTEEEIAIVKGRG